MALQKGENVVGCRGRYEIESFQKQGGLGRVWRAKADDGSTVAVKEPLMGMGQDQVTIEKLQIEAVVLEKLTGRKPMILSPREEAYDLDPSVKPHIVAFEDVSRSAQPRVLVLEFVDGTSMDERFRSGFGHDDLVFGQVDAYAATILSTVRALHQNNILHRDISPHNLMCTTDVRRDPVLLDFGTAKEGFRQLPSSGLSRIMKEGYSAPELAYGDANPSSDLYSASATILFLYTGLNPTKLINAQTKFMLDMNHPAVKKIPHDQRQVLAKALSFFPADRYQTAGDLLAALGGKPMEPTQGKPLIVASGRKYEVDGPMIMGRSHGKCGPECLSKGFSHPPDIAINDSQQFVSRHHAKVQLDRNGNCWIEDLRSPSHTAIKRASGYRFEELTPGKGYKLEEGDIIALAFSRTKGPYLTVSYHTK